MDIPENLKEKAPAQGIERLFEEWTKQEVGTPEYLSQLKEMLVMDRCFRSLESIYAEAYERISSFEKTSKAKSRM